MTTGKAAFGGSALARRLEKALEGEVLFDAFSRGRYATDASIYQIEPLGVVVPKSREDVAAAIAIAGEAEVPILPRGGGTSQCGQTVGRALVLDFSKYMNKVVEFDAAARQVRVEPGLVLDPLNAFLKPHGLFFPVDVSTASRATLGGMAGNNSCGARSIRYGNMVHNVGGIEAILADGARWHFGPVPGNLGGLEAASDYRDLVTRLRAIAASETEEMAARWPKLLRRVGGYNLDSLSPAGHNMAEMLVGSEGTLAAFTQLDLTLAEIPRHKVLGLCHFQRLYDAMAATKAIVGLEPDAVELADSTLIALAGDIPLYAETIERFIKGRPEALLLVEFAGEEPEPLQARLRELDQLLADRGFPGAVVALSDAAEQAAIWEVRKAGLNIMMSMKGDGKPVSFIEDCAVSLEDLADYTERLTQVFEKHGTRGTWYAHASVGCLHVRPVLNMKDGRDVAKMRAIAEEAFAMVRAYKGSHSGEHGDGLVRSEFHEAMFGPRLTRAFEAVKACFDPEARFNPGKIVHPPKMDDRSLFRFKPGYRTHALDAALDWSAWGGFAGAVEMCNNNGACRKRSPGVMCPSYRATGDEQHLTRGRANTLRLALSGQLGEGALTSDDLYDTMALCVGCKGCKRECPTGVDLARMKVEFLHHYRKRHRLTVRDRLVAKLPHYAPWAARLAPLMNLRNRVPALARLGEAWLGLSDKRPLPHWRQPFLMDRDVPRETGGSEKGKSPLLFADCFNRYFEPENLAATVKLLRAGGYAVEEAVPAGGGRPLCCGRPLLAVGLVEEARREARRTISALQGAMARDATLIGIEPSCLLTLRDEFLALLPGEDSRHLAKKALLVEEYLAREAATGCLGLALRPLPPGRVLLHGHCHQKAFDVMPAVEQSLSLVPGIEVETIASGCCGMAGAFGYEAEHYEMSVKMAELDLLPAIRGAPPEVPIVACGTSCRQQIRDQAGRPAQHLVQILVQSLAGVAA